MKYDAEYNYSAYAYGMHEHTLLKEDFQGDLENLIASKGISIQKAHFPDGQAYEVKNARILVNKNLTGRKLKEALAQALGMIKMQKIKKWNDPNEQNFEIKTEEFIETYARKLLDGNTFRGTMTIAAAVVGAIVFYCGSVIYLNTDLLGALASFLAGAITGATLFHLYAEFFSLSESLEDRLRLPIHDEKSAYLVTPAVTLKPKSQPRFGVNIVDVNPVEEPDEAQLILSEAEETEREIFEALDGVATLQADETRDALRSSVEQLEKCVKISQVSKRMLNEEAESAEFREAIIAQREEHKALLEKMRYINFSMKKLLVETLKSQYAAGSLNEEALEQLKSAKDGFGYLQSSYEKLDQS